MIRLTGMNSGLDTERIIHELVRNQREKVDRAKQNQVSNQWRQDAWKDLNNRALKLFGKVGQMRFSTAYAMKTSKVSSNRASVVTGATAANGVQNLTINRLATSGIITGSQIKTKSNGAVGTNTRLSDIMDIPAGEDTSFTIRMNGSGAERQVNLSGSMTIQNVVQQFRDAGLNANFDTGNGRFFISSRTIGEDGDFTIVANNANGLTALDKLGINFTVPADYAGLAGINKSTPAGLIEWNKLVDADVAIRLAADERARDAAQKALTDHQAIMAKRMADFREWLDTNDKTWLDAAPRSDADIMARMQFKTDEIKTARDDKQADIDDINGLIDAETDENIKAQLIADRDVLLGELADLNKQITATGYDAYDTAAYTAALTRETDLTTARDDAQAVVADTTTRRNAAEAKVDADIAFAQHAMTLPASTKDANGNLIGPTGASRIFGQNAEIVLNGAKFESNTNVFNINGLTITANQADPNEVITITTEDDTAGVFNVIRDFLKEYNALINEMDRLFNAPNARDFRPLTDEQKDAMSAREIDEWEKRIKDSLLRRDSSLFNISNLMKTAMMGGVQVNGRTMHLSSFGINAMDFFLAAPNEKNALFIDGDEDSSHVSNKPNRLKEMIANDPKLVSDFFTKLSHNLHDAMNKVLMERNADFKSFNTIYNDKHLKREFDNFTKEIARQEERLTKMEDKFFRQFSKMEVALAKMQSNQSAITGLLGMTMMNR